MRLWYVAVATAVVVLDHLTKLVIVLTMPVGRSVPVIEDVFHITHVRNPGAAFGLLRGVPGILALAGLIGVVVFVVVFLRDPPAVIGLGAALVAGGALGNLIDRIVRDFPFHGTVVDFVDLRVWPAFNIADMAISVGAVVLIVAGFFEPTRHPPEAADTGRDEPAPDRDR